MIIRLHKKLLKKNIIYIIYSFSQQVLWTNYYIPVNLLLGCPVTNRTVTLSNLSDIEQCRITYNIKKSI